MAFPFIFFDRLLFCVIWCAMCDMVCVSDQNFKSFGCTWFATVFILTIVFIFVWNSMQFQDNHHPWYFNDCGTAMAISMACCFCLIVCILWLVCIGDGVCSLPFHCSKIAISIFTRWNPLVSKKPVSLLALCVAPWEEAWSGHCWHYPLSWCGKMS